MISIHNKRILVTGVCGTVGARLVELLLTDSDYNPAEVIGVDNNESELFFLEQQFSHDGRLNCFCADIRDRDTLTRLTRGVEVIFHLAALKHVVLCERSPFDAVQTNILGVQNIIHAANDNQVEKVIFTSSDKAVNPTNVMGTSKLMGERLMTAANSHHRGEATIFASTRFGNVLGSRGSVIPIFHKQISQGGPVTLTDPLMTRFIMSIYESVRLVVDSVDYAKGGEVFVTKMPVIRVKDLAEVMIDALAPQYGYDPANIAITTIGSKPGEKLYEELMNQEETRRAIELSQYFSILPAFSSLYRKIVYEYPDTVSKQVNNPYNSSLQPGLSKTELRDFLVKNHLLAEYCDISQHPDQSYWPEHKENSQ